VNKRESRVHWSEDEEGVDLIGDLTVFRSLLVELDSRWSCNNDSGRGCDPSQQQITEDDRFRDESIPVMERS
jgi:hypothetical protein